MPFNFSFGGRIIFWADIFRPKGALRSDYILLYVSLPLFSMEVLMADESIYQ